MTSVWHGLMALVMQLGTVSPSNPVTGKPWERYLIPFCDDLIPKGLREQWNLKVTTAKRDPDVYSELRCACDHGQRKVSITYECGSSEMKTPSASKGGFGALPIVGLGRWAAAFIGSQEDDVSLHAYDEDTPCKISVYWPDRNGLDTAKKLMKDLLAAATPAVVGKPRLEAIYLDPQSAAGRAFFTSPEAWKKESAGLKDYIVLAAGFPKIVEGKAFPGLPDGKVALVGMCLIGDGGIAHTDALPGLQRALVDAQGAEPSCPAPAVPRTWWEVDGDTEIKLGQRTLVLNFFHDRGVTYPKTRARAYLREADGSLVSFAADELDLDPRAYEKDCKVTVKPGRSGATLKVHCKLGTPDRCKKNPWWSFVSPRPAPAPAG